MTGNQASSAPPGLPAQAATARPHDPAGHHATVRRPADLPLAAVQKKTARYAPLLLGGAAAAVLAMAAAPATRRKPVEPDRHPAGQRRVSPRRQFACQPGDRQPQPGPSRYW